MIFEFDLGNSRFKWRLCGAEGSGAADGAPLLQGVSVADGPAILEVVSGLAVAPRRVRGGSVAAQHLERVLADAVARRWGLPTEFAQSSAEAAGVRNGYTEPARLGVDRWLALVAGYRLTGGPVLVVDAGSALTIDLVDSAGRHLGGYIVPGRRMLQEGLQTATARVRFDPAAPVIEAPGRDTATAVEGGLRLVACGAVRAAMAEAAARLGQYRLLITGGDGPLLLGGLRGNEVLEAQLLPDLVLEGLRWVLP